MKCICCSSDLKTWLNLKMTHSKYCPFPDCPYYHLPVNPSSIKATVETIRRVKISEKDIENWVKKWRKKWSNGRGI